MYKKMIKKIIKKVKEFYYTSSSERFIKYLVSGGGKLESVLFSEILIVLT